MGTIPETLSKETILVTFSTSPAGPTDDPSPSNHLKRTQRYTTVKVLQFSRRSRAFMHCTRLVRPQPSQPSRNSSKSLLMMAQMPLPSPPLLPPSHILVEPQHPPNRRANKRRLTLQPPPNPTIPQLFQRRQQRRLSASLRRLLRVPTARSASHPSSTSSKQSPARN